MFAGHGVLHSRNPFITLKNMLTCCPVLDPELETNVIWTWCSVTTEVDMKLIAYISRSMTPTE